MVYYEKKVRRSSERQEADGKGRQPMREQREEHHQVTAGPLLRVTLFGPLHLHWLVPTESDEDAWHRRTSACALFCLLLCAPQRRASRSQLAAALWPEVDEPRAIESLRVATRALRIVLRPASGEALLHSLPGGLLQLANQSQLEVDIDTFEALVQQASTRSDEREALVLWEQARALVCGEFLADHVRGSEWSTHRWIKIRQRDLNAARRRMICALADGSIRRGQLVQAELLLQGHVSRFPGDQDAVFRLVKLLIEGEHLGEARESYQRCKAALASSGKQPAEHIKALEEYIHAPIEFLADHIIKPRSSPAKRFSQLSLSLSTHVGLDAPGENRSLDLSHASIINLATITQQFRAIQRQGDVLITAGVHAHMQTIQESLACTVDDQRRQDLWKLLALTQIVAAFNPMKKTEQGRVKTFLEAAIASARSSDDIFLVGAALGHLAHFSLRVEQNLEKALQLLHTAQEVVHVPHPLHGWFALIMASLDAKAGQTQHCEAHLTEAMSIAHQLPKTPAFADLYLTDFDLISVHTFMINSWLTMGKAEKAFTHLRETPVEALSDNRRASAFYDASRACIMMGEFDMAQHFAFQAIDKAYATQQWYVIPRCLQLAHTVLQKEPHHSQVSAIADYARIALQRE